MEKIPRDNKKDVFLIGGSDLEMYQIEKHLRRNGKEFVSRNLQWGAKIDDYVDEVERILSEGKDPVAIELSGADKIEGVIDIDHHNEKNLRPASISQVMSRINKPMSLVDEMIAANDSSYIPGMEAKMEEYKPLLEGQYGKERFQELKTKLINLIRAKDRQMQGVTAEMEKSAEEALENKEEGPNNLIIVRYEGEKPSPISDRLFSNWGEKNENLIVVCKKAGVIYYFGPGHICKEVKDTFSGFGGGVGFGQKDKNGFSGVKIDDPEKVIDFIKSHNSNE